MSLRIPIAIVLAAAAVFVPASPASAAGSFLPVADTYVDSSNPTTNYGNQTSLRVDNAPARRAYLRFTVQGAGSESSAVLKFYVESGSHTGVEVHAVADTSWGETTTTYNTAPGVGALLGVTGAFPGGTSISVDVSTYVTGDGVYSFALVTTDDTAIRLSSREGANPPRLLVPAPPSPSPYLISRVGDSYQAVSSTTGTTFTGSLKVVGENAVADLEATPGPGGGSGGGTVRFAAGVFDFGSDFFKFFDLHDIVFEGAGIDVTVLQNVSSAAGDTEPFNFTGADRVTVRDLTVSAGGPARFTSDALDFDRGNDVVVERVKVTASRGRGIVFDGKNADWTSLRNTVRDCVVTGVPSDGIELLASSQNTIQGCAISNVGGHGIQLVKSSPTADQPNKRPNDNIVTGNVIDQAGQDGINVTSGDRNQVTGNMVTNSSDDTAGRDGIRITSLDNVACNDTVVSGNTATDNQTPKTQKYGLNITSGLCNRTVVGPANTFTGNLTGPSRDLGTGTIYA